MNSIQVNTPVGHLTICEDSGCIVSISKKSCENTESNDVLEQCRIQLMEYFDKKRRIFDFPMYFEGTDFQKAVWKAMMEIKYGETVSYQKLAKMAGYPNAVRAVGTACGKNPLCIVVPCHRVIRSDGQMGNYAWGQKMKQYLLKLEMEES